MKYKLKVVEFDGTTITTYGKEVPIRPGDIIIIHSPSKFEMFLSRIEAWFRKNILKEAQ